MTGMKPILPRNRLFFCVLILGVMVAALSCWSVHALLIEKMPEARPVYVARVRPGDGLSMGYLHSVEHCRIWDFLRIDPNGGMVVVATEFAESRTGLPYAAFAGEVFQRRGDGFRISNMHRPVPEIWQWVNAEYENTLKINDGREIRLAALAGDTLLHIRIAELNALEWAWTNLNILKLHRSF